MSCYKEEIPFRAGLLRPEGEHGTPAPPPLFFIYMALTLLAAVLDLYCTAFVKSVT